MIHKPHRLFFIPKPRLVAALLALWLLQLWTIPADAGVESPLKPIDTSSPRATLQSFLEFMNSGYAKGAGIVESYLASPKLYLSTGGCEYHQRLPPLPGIGPTGTGFKRTAASNGWRIVSSARHTTEGGTRPHRSPSRSSRSRMTRR